jgi:hypothetical protein
VNPLSGTPAPFLNQQSAVKKVRELFHLRRLGELLPVLPAGQCQETEEPDFVFASPSERIGIEVIEYHDQSETAREKAQLDILCRAEGLHKAAKRPPLWVNVAWNPSANFTKAMRSTLPTQLAELVHANTPFSGSCIKLRSPDRTKSNILAAIGDIEINRYATEPNDLWCSLSCPVPRQLNRSALQRLLDKKSVLVPKYRKQASTIWLLVVCGRALKSTQGNIPNSIALHRFEAAFDRAFLLSYFPDYACELVIGSVSAP